MAGRLSFFGKRQQRISASAPTAKVEEAPLHAMSNIESSAAPVGALPAPVPTFEEVYDAHFAFVWRNVLNRGVPASAVDDVVQEVFLVVHRKLDTFEGRSSLRTWLAAVVRRVVKDYLQKRGNAPLGEPLDEEGPGGATGPGEALEARRAAKALDELLGQMPEAQREVFILHEIEELTGREIAEAVNANENTVHTRLRAARRIFREGLARLRSG
jgi:RNA polymerase sigma-70 factor (ECF subfamily)